jgi:hypothetical protein
MSQPRKAKAGYALCVLDRGAVRFQFPRKWILKQGPDSVQVHDCEPPGDNCVLDVSRFSVPAERRAAPMRELVAAAVANDERQILERKEIAEVRRDGLEFAWIEVRYVDAQSKREAFSRLGIGYGSGVHCLMTYDFWADQSERLAPVWNDVLRSLVLGGYAEE